MQRPTRRDVLRSGCAAACGCLASLAAGCFAQPVNRQLMTTAVAVPHDFLGMHLHRWPAGSPRSPAPAYRYGSARSHDYSGNGTGLSWAAIHTADGVYRWAQLDAWVAAHQQLGHTLLYTLYGTPSWLATSTRQDAYGHVGGASAPRSLAPLAAFIDTLVRRYRSALQIVEIWNEPHFVQNYASFWWGTAPQLAAMGRTVYQTAKAADPTLRVLTPGFDDNLTGALTLENPSLADCQQSSLYQYLSASDGNGGRGSDWCDAIAFHTYEATLADDGGGVEKQLLRLHSMLRLMGVARPIFCTECGFRPGSAFRTGSPASQAAMLRRLAAVLAACRIQGLYYYAHDDDFIGNPSVHPELAAALEDIHTRLAGSQLKQVTRLAGGSIRVDTHAGTFLW